MNWSHRLTQQLLETFHTRICRLEYLSGKLKRPLDKDDWTVLEEVYEEYRTRYPNPTNRPYTMQNVEVNSVDDDLIVQVLSRGKTLHVKVCKDSPYLKYRIWTFGDDTFESSTPSISNRREVPRTGKSSKYLGRIHCKGLDNLMNILLEYMR